MFGKLVNLPQCGGRRLLPGEKRQAHQLAGLSVPRFPLLRDNLRRPGQLLAFGAAQRGDDFNAEAAARFVFHL